MDIPVKSGYIYKRGRKYLKNWKNRYVLVYRDRIEYFVSHKSTRARGVFPLHANSMTILEHSARPHGILVKDGGGDFFLAAKSEEEKGHWVRALRNVKNLLEADLLIRDGPEEADSLDPEAAATWGILTVNLVKAENLVASDSGGTSDPYAVVRVGLRSGTTRTVEKSLNPEWNQQFSFNYHNFLRFITIEVYDKDRFGRDDFLGRVVLPLSQVTVDLQCFTLPLGRKHFKGVAPASGTITVQLKSTLPMEKSAFTTWECGCHYSAIYLPFKPAIGWNESLRSPFLAASASQREDSRGNSEESPTVEGVAGSEHSESKTTHGIDSQGVEPAPTLRRSASEVEVLSHLPAHLPSTAQELFEDSAAVLMRPFGGCDDSSGILGTLFLSSHRLTFIPSTHPLDIPKPPGNSYLTEVALMPHLARSSHTWVPLWLPSTAVELAFFLPLAALADVAIESLSGFDNPSLRVRTADVRQIDFLFVNPEAVQHTKWETIAPISARMKSNWRTLLLRQVEPKSSGITPTPAGLRLLQAQATAWLERLSYRIAVLGTQELIYAECPELKALGSVHFPLRRSSTPSTQLEHAALDDAALSSRGALRQQGSSQRALVKRTAEHFPMSPDPTPKPRYLSAALKAIVEYYKATQEGWAFDLTMELNRQGIDWNHWRMSSVNKGYQLCCSYPELLPVPQTVSDYRLRQAAGFRSRERLPVLTYYHKATGAVLCRSSQPRVGVFMGTSDADDFLLESIRVSCDRPAPVLLILDARSRLNAVANHARGKGYEHVRAGKDQYKHCKVLFMGIGNIHDMRSSYDAMMSALQAPPFTVLMGFPEVLAWRTGQHTASYPNPTEGETCEPLRSLESSAPAEGTASHHRTEKTPAGVEPLEAKEEEEAVLGNGSGSGSNSLSNRFDYTQFDVGDDEDWDRSIAASSWLRHVSQILAAAVRVAKALTRHNLSVLVHCSDGWDRTTQMVTLAQLLVDPYFRTIRGFATLIDKDWCAFGFKFQDRCGRGTEGWSGNERSPIWHQWCDAVYQILRQFPHAFEFNAALLRDLSFFSNSCWFGNFLFNSERERSEAKVADKTFSFWTFVHSRRALYLNSKYTPPLPPRGSSSSSAGSVLIPVVSTRRLKLWDGWACDWGDRFLRWHADLHGWAPPCLHSEEC